MMNPTLTRAQAFILYRGMVCQAIEEAMCANMIDGDLWQFTDCLDMSFDETAEHDFYEWPKLIQADLKEFLGKKPH